MKKAWGLCIALLILSFVSCTMAEVYKTDLGVQFGMAPQEVQDIETENNHKLTNDYLSLDSYQLYYETDIHFYSLKCVRMEYDFDIVDRLLYQVYYVSKGGKADYAYIKTVVDTKYGSPVTDTSESGEYSLLYDQLGIMSHIVVSHWLVPSLNLGIDLWYNDYDTVFVTFYDTTNPASYGAIPRYYTDETGISFAYMDGWDAIPFSFNELKISFSHRSDNQTSVQYFQTDLWESLKGNLEPFGFKREDIGPTFLDDEVVSLLMQPIVPQSLRTKTFGSNIYRVFDYQNDNDAAYPDLYHCTVALTLKDGYVYMFQLSSVSIHDECMPAFEALLSTVTFGSIAAPSHTDTN